jgi:hypothetical protein
MIVAYSFISRPSVHPPPPVPSCLGLPSPPPGGVGAARCPPRPNPHQGTPPGKNERAVDAIHPRLRRATGEIISDNRRRQTNPDESTDPPAVASSSFRVRKFVVVSERKFVVIRIARRQTVRAPVAQSLLREVGRRSCDDMLCPAASSSIAHPFSFIGSRPAKRNLYIWRADDEGEETLQCCVVLCCRRRRLPPQPFHLLPLPPPPRAVPVPRHSRRLAVIWVKGDGRWTDGQ